MQDITITHASGVPNRGSNRIPEQIRSAVLDNETALNPGSLPGPRLTAPVLKHPRQSIESFDSAAWRAPVLSIT